MTIMRRIVSVTIDHDEKIVSVTMNHNEKDCVCDNIVVSSESTRHNMVARMVCNKLLSRWDQNVYSICFG